MSHALKVSLMRNLLQDYLNKTNNHCILLGQVPIKTLTFSMICALRNKQVMPSRSWVIILKLRWTKRNRKSILGNWIGNKLRSDVAFVQLSHPTSVVISVMMTKLNTACSQQTLPMQRQLVWDYWIEYMKFRL